MIFVRSLIDRRIFGMPRYFTASRAGVLELRRLGEKKGLPSAIKQLTRSTGRAPAQVTQLANYDGVGELDEATAGEAVGLSSQRTFVLEVARGRFKTLREMK